MALRISGSLKSYLYCLTCNPLLSSLSHLNLQVLQRAQGTRLQLSRLLRPQRLQRPAAFHPCRRLRLQQLLVILLLPKLRLRAKHRTSMPLCLPRRLSLGQSSHLPLVLRVRWLSTRSLLLPRCHHRLSVQSRTSLHLHLQRARCLVLLMALRPRLDETATR